MVVAEDDIFPGREFHDQTFGLAILWNMRNATRAPGLAVGVFAGQINLLPVDCDRTGGLLKAA